MKHTPGPWRKQGNLIFGEGPGSHVAKLFTRTQIEPFKSGAEEEAGNASLIAAAPEMLEALEELSWFIDHIMGEKKRVDWGRTFDMDWGRINSTLLLMRRASAKAKGEL